jgi:hypothetical protein
MSADSLAVLGASAPATSAALWTTVGLALSTDGSYAPLAPIPPPVEPSSGARVAHGRHAAARSWAAVRRGRRRADSS